MDKWVYMRNGAVEGPVSKDRLKALYQAGEITRQTLVRSSTAGGGWRRYEEIADFQTLAAQYLPRAVRSFWPWFVFGTPLVVGLTDVFLVQSTGNKFVESNAWLSHGPFGLSLAILGLWLFLIWFEIQKKHKTNRFGEMVIWFVAAPVYQALSWWAAAAVASLINFSFGYGLASCQADIVKADVEAQFQRAAAQKRSGESSAGITNVQQQWITDRMRLCTGTLVTTNSQNVPVRYRIESRGASLFRNTMHGLYVTAVIE